MTYFKFTTADENGGLGESVGADHGTAVPRAATSLNQSDRRDGARRPP